MTFGLFTDVRETSTAPGSGYVTLNGPIDSTYRAFSDVFGVDDTFHYVMRGEAGREFGIGKMRANGQISREYVIWSTNSPQNLVNFNSGTVDIAVSNLGPSDLTAAQLGDVATAFGALTFAAPQLLSGAQQAQVRANLESIFWPTGRIRPMIATTAAPGWLMLNDGTLGDASSGASYHAADAEALFTMLYNNISDTFAPLFTSAGIATTRAAQGTAAAAWASHCRVTALKALGRALGAAGAGSGLTARSLGQTVGGETVLLTSATTPVETHVFTGTPGPVVVNTDATDILRDNVGLTVSPSGGIGRAGAGVSQQTSRGSFTPAGTINSHGSGGAHDNVGPMLFVNMEIKL